MSAGNHAPNAHNAVARFQPRVAGIASAFELALRFVTWANQLHADPTASQICERYGVSRATAFRWLAAWRAVNGNHARRAIPK